MRKVLVIAYYTPPLGMSGVMRVTKLVKFLPAFGWQPVVLTVRKVAYYHYDETLLLDWRGTKVFRARSLDPARLRYLLRPNRPESGLAGTKASFVANVLCFPDAKAGWYPFALSLGKRIVREEEPDAIFATAPPFTSLMLGESLKKWSGLPLVADFRDPWPMGLIPPPSFLRRRVERFRHGVITAADAVLAVNQGTAAHLAGRAEVLENGFDPDEFAAPPRRFEQFTVLCVGNVWETEAELGAVLEATRPMPDVKVVLIGKTRMSGQDYPHFENLGLLAHHDAVAAMKGAGLLLYLSKPKQPAGIKLYEYLGAGRPILSVGQELTEADEMIAQHRAGLSVKPDRAEIGSAIARLRSDRSFLPKDIARFNRRNQAERLARVFDRLCS